MRSRKFFLTIYLLVLGMPVLAQDTDIFDPEGSADSIPRRFETIGIQVVASTRNGFTQYIPALTTTTNIALSQNRKSLGGFSLYFGGMSDNEGLYGILCAEGIFTQYLIGNRNSGLFTRFSAGFAQSFFNPLSQFSSIMLKRSGFATSAFLGFQAKTFRWLPPVQIMGGYRYISLDRTFSAPAVQISFVL